MTERQPVLTRTAIIMVILAGISVAVFELKHTLSCFLLSYVFAYLFDPFVVFLEKKGLKRSSGIAVLYAILGLFAVFCIAYLVPFMTLRWQELLGNLPGYLQKVKELGGQLKGRLNLEYGGQEIEWLFNTVDDNIDTVISKIGAGFYATASRMVFNLLNLILSPILVFFMLYYKREIIEEVAASLPSSRRVAIVELGRDINRSMGGFIRGQIVVSFIVAVLASVALFFLDVDYPLLNGMFAGAASILPFVGVFLAMIPPLFFAYVKFQSGMILVKVLVSFAVIYFLEGYVVKPLVFKESMDLNPLVTILMVMSFGELMGFWGILLAIPIAAALKTLSHHVRRGSFSAAPAPRP